MANGMEANAKEIEFRRRWYEAHARRAEADPDYVEFSSWMQTYRAGADRAKEIRDQLADDGDLERFKIALRDLADKHGAGILKGSYGAGYLNSMVKRTDDHAELVRLLIEGITVPMDSSSAAQKLRSLIEHAIRIKRRGHPFPGITHSFLTFFWGFDEANRWPVCWGHSTQFMSYITGENWHGGYWSDYSQLPDDKTREDYLKYLEQRSAPPGEDSQHRYPGESYLRYIDRIEELDDDPERYDLVARWWRNKKPLFLDPVLVERCAFGQDTKSSSLSAQMRSVNKRALASIAHHFGRVLTKDISEGLGFQVRPEALRWYRSTEQQLRSDLRVDWQVETVGGNIGLRLGLSHQGAAIGVKPGWVRDGWYDEAREIMSDVGGEDFQILDNTRRDEPVGFLSGVGGFMCGRWYDLDRFGDLNLRAEVGEVAVAARPIIEAMIEKARDPRPDDPLWPDVRRFHQATDYPTERDDRNKAAQSVFRRMLVPENLPAIEPSELKQLWSGQKHGYGHPGIQPALTNSVNNADESEYQRILDAIHYLCWGEDDDVDRIDAVLDDDSIYRVHGLGGSVIMKLLAVCHPDRYLCTYPYTGKFGKLRMLRVLGLEEPSEETSTGRRHVEANDRLRERLEPFFPGDPWGMMKFLYWYAERDEEAGPEKEYLDPVGEAAEDLLVERSLLDDIVSLLEDKGQVILYGPPGTGKTFLARRLAKALASDPAYRTLVQFHPSTSYEDFFEGYRPEQTADGGIGYRLTPGPLARMAEHALEHPDRRHVMVIDEINRANLPRVLGELLFLFEYRDEQVSTLYRSEDEFWLPDSIWFIGTMNTADRSIALVDAALRRRFHFVPFFPGRGPTVGLLGRWLAKTGGPGWVGELVEMVNGELAEAIGEDLQLGFSHFMREGYLPEPGVEDGVLRRIWKYNIEPFVEDQLFGDQDRINRFRFERVVARFRNRAGYDSPQDGPADQTEEGPDDPSPMTRTEDGKRD